ncbi:DUF4097 family beta strand repeat-containing protein [uncultured Chloroflexus sp.]|uniref:DUF4097 family beta strand repeat-containing protein n=1 Tax=uncultured Chloroflexus sp. TaxID=214040 RepID=UPI00262F902A|nr:DUF4097 family beta strand repeat-containing protein [uncultured Chloroflexus sp.]
MRITDLPIGPERPVERRIGRRLLGIALILGGLSWLLFELLSRGTIAGIDLNLARSDSAQTIPAQRFTVARVEVSGMNDQVIVNGTTGEEVIVSGSRLGFGWAANAAADAAAQIDVHIEQRGDTLYINVNHQPWAPWSFGRNPYARLELALPPDVTFNISLVSGDVTLRQTAASGTISTMSGDVIADGARGQLTINTTSGDLDLRDYRGLVRVTTVSGDLTATGQLDDVRVQTTSGDVTLRGALGTIQITTVSGNVNIETAEPVRLEVSTTNGKISFTGRLLAAPQQLNTISGDIDLTLQSLTNAHLVFSTVSGRINVPDPLAAQVVNRRSLTMRIGEGGVDLNVTSTSGNITVRFRSP